MHNGYGMGFTDGIFSDRGRHRASFDEYPHERIQHGIYRGIMPGYARSRIFKFGNSHYYGCTKNLCDRRRVSNTDQRHGFKYVDNIITVRGWN